MRIPEDPNEAKRLLGELFSLSRSDRGQALLAWISQEVDRLDRANRTQRDELKFRWGQGAIQALAELANTISNSGALMDSLIQQQKTRERQLQ